MYELGELLKRLRGKLSLREVAKLSGLSFSYISSLEKGKHPRTGAPINPTPETLRVLSKTYNYPYSDLMKRAGYSDDMDKEGGNGGLSEEDQKKREIERLIRKITKDMGLEATEAFLKQLAGEK